MIQPHTADVVLTNGRVTTLADTPTVPSEVSAVAVRSGCIEAVGSHGDLEPLIGPATTVIDLGGRRVIPGLIDSHVHAVRAGLTWNDEIRWENVRSLEGGLQTIREAAERTPAGTWLRVIGGWHPQQFAEGRAPTREDLDRVAPEHPVFVQRLYDWGLLNSRGIQALGLDAELAQRLNPDAFEYGADGQPNGMAWGMAVLGQLYALLPQPSFEQRVESTAALSKTLASYGLTCFIDGGGTNTGPDVYPPLYEAWQRGALATRVRLAVHGGNDPEAQVADIEGFQRYLRPGFGDPMLRILGAGEAFIRGFNDRMTQTGDLSAETLQQLEELLLGLAANRWPVHVHAHQTTTIETLLDMWERIHAQHPITDLRWSIVHGEGLQPEMLPRLRALGAGVLVQGLFYFMYEQAFKGWGPEGIKEAPPLRRVLDAGIPVALGTDAMRVASYNPFDTIAWFLHGRTVEGDPTLATHNLLSREEALRGYTSSAAWFAFEEDELGKVVPGAQADVAVLDRDFFDIAVEDIPDLRSVLTLVGGRVSWSDGSLADAAVERLVE